MGRLIRLLLLLLFVLPPLLLLHLLVVRESTTVPGRVSREEGKLNYMKFSSSRKGEIITSETLSLHFRAVELGGLVYL